MMEADPEQDQRGFENSGGPAPYTAKMLDFEFQDGMWGKWIEVQSEVQERKNRKRHKGSY